MKPIPINLRLLFNVLSNAVSVTYSSSFHYANGDVVLLFLLPRTNILHRHGLYIIDDNFHIISKIPISHTLFWIHIIAQRYGQIYRYLKFFDL